jgi:flagellar basal body P-ring protein FlgI
MQKFTEYTEKEKNGVIVETLDSKIDKMITESITVSINHEPKLNENYSLQGKDKVIEELSKIFDDELTKTVENFNYSKYRNVLNTIEIDEILVNLKSKI